MMDSQVQYRWTLFCRPSAISAVAVMGLAGLAIPGFAQETVDSTLQGTRASGVAALQHLRDADAGKALDSLAAAADAIRNVHPTEDEGVAAAAGGAVAAWGALFLAFTLLPLILSLGMA